MKKKGIGLLVALLLVPLALSMSCCSKKAVKPTKSIAQEGGQAQSSGSAVKEEGLAKKKYPGIQGEFLESKALKDIHFDFDKFDIKSSAAAVLNKNAEFLLAHPTYKIQIEGHCDERGSVEYNLVLGERRAESTNKFLSNLGVDKSQLSTISYGEEMPLDPRHNEEAWAKNRRCHFIILAK